VSGGVGIGQSVNIGGRIGVGTNIHIAALNVQTPSASTLGIVIQGSTSQSASLFRVNSSVGGSFFEITNSGIVNIKTSTAGDYNSVPLQRWYGDSDAIVGVMQKGGFFYTGYGLGYVDGAGSQTLVHQWVPNGSYYVTNWSKRMANGTQIMFSSSAGGDVRIYGDTNGSLTFQSYGTYTNNTMVKLLDPNIGTNQALLGVVPQVGGMRSQLYSYGNLSLNMAVAGSAGTDWDTTNLFRANVYTKTKYLGNLAVLAVDDTNRFVVGPYGDTTVSLGGTTVSNALILKGASSQTGNLMEFQSSTGTTYLFINSSGQLGPVTIASTTGSGSTTTGALIVSGGVGIGGSLNVFGTIDVSDNIKVLSQKEVRFFNSANTFYTGLRAGSSSANVTFTLPIADGTANQVLYTNGSAALGWTSNITGTATSAAFINTDASTATRYLLGTVLNTASGSTQLSTGSGITIGNNLLTSGGIAITGSTASTSSTTGALIVSGGAGIALTSYFAQDVKIQGSTASTSSTTGALVVTGGVGIGGTLNVNTANIVRDFNHTPNITTIGGASGWVASTASTFISPGTFRYLNNKYIGIGGTYIYYSDDMLNWSSVMVPNLDPARSIANITYGEGKYVFVQYYTANAGYSTNLTNWTNVAITYQTWNDVIYGNGRFVATVGGDLAAYSLDGTSWTSVTDSIALGYNTSLKFLNGYFYVTNSNGISRSIDGITWQACNTPAVPNGLAYGNGLYVGGVYNSGTIVYSYDGLNFSSYSGTSYVHTGAAFFNGVYYLLTQNNLIIRYSTDGFNWTNSTGFSSAVFNLQYISQYSMGNKCHTWKI
jgi:hypothetical protein